jgi:hypothetical protein
MKKRRRDNKRIRQPKTISKAKSRAILAPYIRELERAKVPPSVVAQVVPLMMILIGGK